MQQVRQRLQADVERCWPSIHKVAACQNECPLNVDVPSYVMALVYGNFRQALASVIENNPLPSVCSRVCHHPCEGSCIRANIDEPIAIRSLKRFIMDHSQRMKRDVSITTGTKKQVKVAVVGSGPAGLTAAHDLAKNGYSVSVYEALPLVGGMLTLGIPEFVLPRDILQSDINHIEKLGVEIMTETAVGKEMTIDDLFRQGYQAVFLSPGAQQSLKLDIPGINLGGVSYALSFLKDAHLARRVSLRGRVVIVGGGNVAIDCARVAVRSGASEVNLICLESREAMPAFSWETKRAEEEGVRVHTSLAPQEVRGKDGKATGVNFARVKYIEFGTRSGIRPVLEAGEKIFFPADSVIVAIGQTVDRSFLKGSTELGMSDQGFIQVNPDTMMTSLEGVFAGGDILGVGTVVEAMAAGRKAAASIDRYIKGTAFLDRRGGQPKQEVSVEGLDVQRYIETRPQSQMPTISLSKRTSSFLEVEAGFSLELALNEAKRCLNCAVCGNCIFGRSQFCYETATRLLSPSKQ